MAQRFQSLCDFTDTEFDTLIDVRSPAEFAEDHVPGAINLPVLSDAERARVGTIYTQVSPFEARKIGAALVARNAARHIEDSLADKPGGWRPLLYCWRGGQRSGSFASILSQIGWRAETVEGGYRTYRRLLVEALYDRDWPSRVILLDGNTGTGKTAVLGALARSGAQVLDLEDLARHRGSVLGPMAGEQPSQKAFESGIGAVLSCLDPDRPLIIEAESSKIGARIIPPSLWRAMQAAPRIILEAPLEARARHLADAYADILGDPEEFAARLDQLRPFHGHEVVTGWQGQLRDRAFIALAANLMEQHYDTRYAKSRARSSGRVLAHLRSNNLDEAGVEALATRVAAAVSEA